MPKSLVFYLFILLFVFSACKNQEVIVPSYLYLAPSKLITKSDGSQGFASQKVEDFYVFKGGETRGIMAVNSTIPLQTSGNTNIKISAGIKYNGMAEQRSIYPMFKYYSQDITFTPNKVDTIKPVFSYVDNAIFPVIEDFDGSGLSFEYNPVTKQVGDTLMLDNSSDAWIPGSFSGKVMLNSGVSGSRLELYSKVFNNWPRFTPFYLEMDYKGNIPITVGLYATNSSGETSQFSLFVLNPKTDWNKLYLDMEPDINKRGTGIQYRIFVSFSAGSVQNPQAWIDNFKVVYLD